MVVATLRRWTLSASCLLVVLMLAACGGGSPAAPAATEVPVVGPEQRVKDFFTAFSNAINDPEIASPERQNFWADELAAYATPDQRTEARDGLLGALNGFGGMTDVGAMVGQAGLDVRMTMNFDITETRLVSESGDNAQVELVDGMIRTGLVGEDAEELGEMAAQFTQEAPLSEFFGADGSEERIFNLERVDGIWYIVDPLQ